MSTIVVAVMVVTGLAGVGIATTTGNGAGATEAGEAELRVAHLSPDAPAVDVLVDGDVALEDVEFGTISDYLEVPAGERSVTIRTSEDESVVFEGEVSLEDQSRYTIAASGEVTEETFEPRVYVDDVEEPSADNASVRLVHASPDAPAVDVTVEESGAVLYDNVSFGNASDYVTVPAGDYTLEVRPATEDNDGEVVTTFDVSVEGGTAYSAFAAGYLSPDEAPADVPFDLLVAADSGGNETEMNASAPT